MTIIERHTERCHLSTVEMNGPVTLPELEAHNAHRFARRIVLTADCLWYVGRETVFTDMSVAKLDAYSARLRALYRAAPLPMVRRTAWLCESEQALPFVRHFLRDRSADDGLYALPRLVGAFPEAAAWLMVSESDLAETLARGEVIATFPTAPRPAM